MARPINLLNATFVRTVTEPGLYSDGGGLYLSTSNGGKRWVFVFRFNGKRREMGLGSAKDVKLAEARDLAGEARVHLRAGRDPIEIRNFARAEQAALAEPAQIPRFGEFAESYIKSVESGWRNDKHRQQWRSTLTQHAAALANISVADVSTQDVLSILQPIWLSLPETASRLRGRIEKVLSAAKAHGFRQTDSINPAQWRGHLEILLPKQSKLSRGHHAAMPYVDIPDFWQRLAVRPAMAARALQFTILTAARSGEVLGATWGEISGDVWNIPAERMKASLPHTVTLSPAALDVLNSIGRGAPKEAIFSGQGRNGHLSNMSMEMLLRRMDAGQFTVHGFRSAFKDWALDRTEFPDEISEEALAHVIGSKVRRAYRRGEALARRRALMDAWADFATSVPVMMEKAA